MTSRDPVAENPYRILALPGQASWREIQRSAEKLRAMESWGAWSSPWDLPLLGPVRREPVDIDAARERLDNVQTRLLDRLFWFHDRDAESAVAYLTPSSIRDAIEGWSSTSLAVARHDAAVVGLVAALTFDPDVEDLPLWRRVIQEWGAALERDDYWIEVLRVEMEAGFLVPATLGDLRDLRESAMVHLATLMLDRAREVDGLAAARAMAILRSELPAATYDQVCGRIPALHIQPSAPRVEAAEEEHVEEEAVEEETAGEPPRAQAHPAGAPVRPVWPVSLPDPRDAPAPRAPEPEAPAPGAAPPRRERKSLSAHMARLRAKPGGPSPPEPAEWADDTPAASDPAPAKPASTPKPAAAPPPAARAEPPALEREPEPEPDAPDAATAPPEPRVQRRARTRKRVLATLTLAAAVATLAILAPWPRLSDRTEPIAATNAGDPARATLLSRIDAADAAIAALLVERQENRTEQAFLRGTIADYRALLADYEFRIDNGLPYDPAGYARVRSYLDNDLAEYRMATEQSRAISDRYDATLRERRRLVAQYNQRVR